MKRLNLVGGGRVGRTLARLWHDAGRYAVQDVHTRSRAGAEAAVAFIGAGRAVETLAAMRPAELWMIAVPDREIAAVAAALAREGPTQAPALAFHCSGFLASEALAPLRAHGWSLASAHPALSFSEPAAALAQFAGTPCGLEGDAPACAEVGAALEAIGGLGFALAAEHKTLYHAAAVFASNFVPVLQAQARELWQASGVPPELVPRLNEALLRNAAENVLALGPARALTGPAARGDTAVVEAQTRALLQRDPLAGEAYRALSALAVRLAQTGSTAPPAP